MKFECFSTFFYLYIVFPIYYRIIKTVKNKIMICNYDRVLKEFEHGRPSKSQSEHLCHNLL